MQTPTTLPLRPLRYMALLGLVILAILMCIGYYVNAGEAAATAAAQEGGIIDLASAIGYFLCALSMIFIGGRHFIKHHYRLIILVTLLGMRELDFDKRFSTLGLFKSATFRSADVSVLEKIITAIIIAAVLWLLISLIIHYSRIFLGSLLRLEGVALITGFAGGMLVVARGLDGIARKLGDLGIAVSPHTEIYTTIAEEVIELGIPATLLVAFFAYYRVYRAPR